MKKGILAVVTVAALLGLIALLRHCAPQGSQTDAPIARAPLTGTSLSGASPARVGAASGTDAVVQSPSVASRDAITTPPIEAAQTLPQSANKPTSNAESVIDAEKSAVFLAFSQQIQPILSGTQTHLAPQEFEHLMKQTDQLQRDHYLMLPEAYMVKDKLLHTQYQGPALERKQTELQDWAQKLRDQLAQGDDPTKDPHFLAYQAKGQAIMEKAAGATSFPNGMTKEQYILQELEKAKQASDANRR